MATFEAENEKAMNWSGCEDVLFKCNGRRDDLNSMREEERMVKMANFASGGRSLQIKPQRNILTKTERGNFS